MGHKHSVHGTYMNKFHKTHFSGQLQYPFPPESSKSCQKVSGLLLLEVLVRHAVAERVTV